MLENFCQLCRETPAQNWELIENWTEVTKMIQVIFKIDLLLDESMVGPIYICCVCNEKLRCVHEFYEMIVEAQEQLKTVVPDFGSDVEDTPQKLDRVDNHRELMHGSKENLSHECDKCGQQFRRLVALKAHMLSHQPKEQTEVLRFYECNECGKKLISKVLLVQHLKQVHIKPNPKNYKNKTHKTTHNAVSVPKVQCKICKLLLLNELRLRAHMKTVHTDNGPHICDICQKESPSSRALKTHKQYVHESVRKYSCTFCEKAFKKEMELKEHMTKHLGGALYGCQFCKTTFNYRNTMYNHRKRMHPEEYQRLQEAKYGK